MQRRTKEACQTDGWIHEGVCKLLQASLKQRAVSGVNTMQKSRPWDVQALKPEQCLAEGGISTHTSTFSGALALAKPHALPWFQSV